MQLVYLHGYATTPNYVQVRDFTARLAQRGVTLHAPDLNVPDFEHLTLKAMLVRAAQTVAALPDGPVGVIGNSMGGAAALHFVDRYRDAEAARVTKLMLLAPALDYVTLKQQELGEAGLAQWRDDGYTDAWHWDYGETRRQHYGLYTDMAQYDSFTTDVRIPTLIYHGTHDEAVPHTQSERYAATRPWVDLRLVDSDHQMLDQSDVIFAALTAFFGV